MYFVDFLIHRDKEKLPEKEKMQPTTIGHTADDMRRPMQD